MRGRIYSLAVSMALAFCLWLNLAGLDTSLLDLTVGLHLHDLPNHLLITGEAPKEVALRVRANAARVRFLTDRKLGLDLDVSQAQEGYNAFPVREPLNMLLPRGVEISFISPETIDFEALALALKQVPVKPSLVGQPAPAFYLEGLTLEPSEVIIKGPPELLVQVEHLETTPLAVGGLTRDTVFTVNVVPPEGLVTIVGSKEIQVTVSLSQGPSVTEGQTNEVKK